VAAGARSNALRVAIAATNVSGCLACDTAAVRLQLEVRSGGECRFGFEANGEIVEVPFSFQAQKGVWIGAKVGLYCHQSPTASPAGHADFDWLRFGAGAGS